VTGLFAGAAAGAAGTTALNAVTYADMAVRARPSSDTPQETVGKLAEKVDRPIQDENRLTGLGSLSGVLTGVGIGAAFGLLHRFGLRLPLPVGAVVVGLSAMAATDGSMAALKVSDPRTWSATDWVSDVVPHLVYGAVTYATLQALDR
jgi:uncharacterized protein YcfJ